MSHRIEIVVIVDSLPDIILRVGAGKGSAGQGRKALPAEPEEHLCTWGQVVIQSAYKLVGIWRDVAARVLRCGVIDQPENRDPSRNCGIEYLAGIERQIRLGYFADEIEGLIPVGIEPCLDVCGGVRG